MTPVAKARGTDGSLLGSLPWTLAALAFAVLPHVPYLPVWITAIFVTCAVGRLLVERRRWHLPATWIRFILASLSFFGVYLWYDGISGVGPGSALLAVMAALKLLETRERRDQFVLLFISIFLIMSSLLREQYLWSLPYLVLGLTLTLTAWLQMSVSQGSTSRQALGNSLRLVAYATPLMLAMWIFFPRIATPFWAVPIDTSSGKTGLSDKISPGDISSLSASDAVAFRVRFDDAVPEPRDRYWRGLVLRHFDGRSWRASEPVMGERDSWPIEYLGSPISYTITMEATRQHYVFALDLPYEWSLERTFMGAQQELARTQPIDQRVEYSATSFTEFRLNADMIGFRKRYYLRLEDDRNPRTYELAAELRANTSNDRELIDQVLRKFRNEEYYYTLEPPTLGRDSVDEFLFDTRRGFCEHYASAFAVLMRSAGIPARVVIGYQGGELNPMGNYMIVRQSDAHAWTEVWLEGDGWTRIDPTAAVAPERIDAGMSGAMFAGSGASWGLATPSILLHRMKLTLDAMSAKWNEWILGYGPDNQLTFMKWLGMENPNFRRMLLTLIVIVAVLLAAITGLLALRYRRRPKDKAAMLYQKLVRKTGHKPERGEAPLAYAARLGRQHPEATGGGALERLTRQYLRLRYASGSDRELDALRKAIAQFRRAAETTAAG